MKLSTKFVMAIVLSILLTLPAVTASAAKIERGTLVPTGPYKYDDGHPLQYQDAQKPNYAYHYRKGIKLFNQGELRRAEKSFKRARGGPNYDFQAHAYLGIINIKQNDHKSAVLYLRKAAKGNPKLYSLKATLGLSYIEIGKADKAEKILKKLKSQQSDAIVLGSDGVDINASIALLEQALANT